MTATSARARSSRPTRRRSSATSTRRSRSPSPTSATRCSPTRTRGSCSKKKEDLAGLSESLVASYAAAAKERKLKGKWLVVNTRSSVDPFLTSSSRRDLREKVWKAFKNRGDNGGESNTNATIAKIVKLRAERAALLGYASHAHWRMSDTMAKRPRRPSS